MKVEMIKAAVEAGLKVHWGNSAYTVIKDSQDQWLIGYMHGTPKANYVGMKSETAVLENLSNFYLDLNQICCCVDDAGNERAKDFITCYPNARLVGYDLGFEPGGRPTWVGVWSYLEGVRLTDEEAHELASDLLVEKCLMSVELQETITYVAI